MPSSLVRAARSDDARAVRVIYAFHVAHGTATFDIEPPDEVFWREKIADVAARGWPFLVAEAAGIVVGYAYATQFRDRAAYAFTCESSLYVADGMRGQGIGRALLAALVDAAHVAGFEQMIAVIGGGEPASVAVHERAGFLHAGRLANVGTKFGKKLDTVYMQRDLTALDSST